MTPKLARLEELALKAKEHIDTHITVLSMSFGKEYANAASPHVILELIGKLKGAREAFKVIATTMTFGRETALKRSLDDTVKTAKKALEELNRE